jgi:L-fuculose-phosphate aldolase
MNDFYEERQSVAFYMKRLYDRQLTTVSGGNISLRLDNEKFCVTPSALDKGNLTPEVIAIVKFDGTNLTPNLKLSIETEMHRLVLLSRSDINAVVHAHPICASAFSTSQPCRLNSKLIAEVYYVLGDIVNVPYFMMGTKKLAEVVAAAIKTHNAILMENHGALTVGGDLLHAFDGLDLLERLAKMTLETGSIPGSHLMSDAQCREIDLNYK